jgi:hypothetical protein
MLRQYHPFWQRFDQPDPYDGSYNLADPQSLNRYSYVQNDPVNFVDPSGLSEIAIDLTSLPSLPDYSGLLSLIWSSLFGGGGEVARYIDTSGGGEGEPQQTPSDKLTSRQDILDAFYCLLKASNFGFDSRERAAWVVAQDNTYNLQRWPWSAEQGRETWKGSRPQGYVAIAHTHPTQALSGRRSTPKPSTSDPDGSGEGDWGAAKQINAPVYTISKEAIWKITGTPLSSTNPVQVAGKDWWKPSEKAKVKCK